VALIHPKAYGVYTKPSIFIQFHFFSVGPFDEIKSQHVLKDASHLRSPRNFQDGCTANICVWGQAKHSFGLLIDN
jgi:hypothetical protein